MPVRRRTAKSGHSGLPRLRALLKIHRSNDDNALTAMLPFRIPLNRRSPDRRG
jgi:hypothetical protein